MSVTILPCTTAQENCVFSKVGLQQFKPIRSESGKDVHSKDFGQPVYSSPSFSVPLNLSNLKSVNSWVLFPDCQITTLWVSCTIKCSWVTALLYLGHFILRLTCPSACWVHATRWSSRMGEAQLCILDMSEGLPEPLSVQLDVHLNITPRMLTNTKAEKGSRSPVWSHVDCPIKESTKIK